MKKSLFLFKFNNGWSLKDKLIIQQAALKWDNYISLPHHVPSIIVTLKLVTGDISPKYCNKDFCSVTIGGSDQTKFYYPKKKTLSSNLLFVHPGEVFPSEGIITILKSNWEKEKKVFFNNSRWSRSHSLIMHELGHILGIGNFFKLKTVGLDSHLKPYSPRKDNGMVWYVLPNGVNMYNKLFGTKLKMIPLERLGKDGTRYGHFLGGHKHVTYRNNTYPALKNELMTGFYSEEDEFPHLSIVTLGVLQDFGYTIKNGLEK